MMMMMTMIWWGLGTQSSSMTIVRIYFSDLISCYLSPHFFGPDDDDKSHTYSLRQYVEIIKLAPAYQSCTLTLRFSLLECFQESVKIF